MDYGSTLLFPWFWIIRSLGIFQWNTSSTTAYSLMPNAAQFASTLQGFLAIEHSKPTRICQLSRHNPSFFLS